MRNAFLAIGFVLGAGALVASESLGDAAKREEARRQRNKERGVVVRMIGADDVRSSSDPRSEPPAPDPMPAAVPEMGGAPVGRIVAPGVPPAPIDETRAREARWRKRAAAARARIEQAEAAHDRAVRSTLPEQAYNTCPHGMNMVRWMMKLDQAREQAKQDVAEARAAFDDLEEQARRDSAAPGWLR